MTVKKDIEKLVFFEGLLREDADDLAFEAADTLRLYNGDPEYILSVKGLEPVTLTE